MLLDWDEAKRRRNIAKHGVDFALAAAFGWETATLVLDRRRDYGEAREVALGFIAGRLFALTFTRRGTAIRVISLRKANRREVRAHAQVSR